MANEFDKKNEIEENEENDPEIYTLTDEEGNDKSDEYVVLRAEADENGEEMLVTIDDDEEFDRIADIFDDMFSDILYDEPEEK